MARSSVGGIARVANYFDYPDSEWERGKAEMTSILQRVAAKRGMIAYSELASQTTTIRVEAFGMPMSEMLGEIGTEENAAKRGILTVVVVHKSGDMEPGVGFYELAQSLGRDTSDHMKLWVLELHKVHDYWAN
jgi:hypothetical protein